MRERSSRLSRTTQEKTKKQIIFFTVAIIVLIFIAMQFGPLLLDTISSAMSGFRKPVNESLIKEDNSLEAPFINSIPEATDSATIHVSGSSTYSDAQVELYVNDDLYDTAPLSSDQKFSFDGVKLSEGNNIINARVKKGDETSSFTKNYNVVYGKGEPKLEVSSPSDNQEFGRGDQAITVQGKTDPDNTVTVNGFVAVVDSSGNFSYYLNLAEGDNDVTIVSTSDTGKKVEKKLKVKYKP